MQRIAAQLSVDAAGAVTQVQLLNGPSLPAALVVPIQEALQRRSVCVPAISGGAAVGGSLLYTLDVDPDEQRAADAAWLQGAARVDVPLVDWLVLKPVRVGEKVFTEIDRIAEGGKVLLKPVTASRADGITRRVEMNAFITDWFWEEGGPNSLKPRAGDKQEVDGQKLVWKAMRAVDGYVDLLDGAGYRSRDFCIGYAWTEFESPIDTDGWIGIGSDDGLRVWFNGELVNNQWLTRRSQLDNDVVRVAVKKGMNRILLKVQNHTRDWSFTSRLRVRGS